MKPISFASHYLGRDFTATLLVSIIFALAGSGTKTFGQSLVPKEENSRIELGIPAHRIFSKSESKIQGQVTCLAFDENGVLYFGDNNGISRYNGIQWVRMPGIEIPIQALAIDKNRRAYFGSANGFGYLSSSDSVKNEPIIISDSILDSSELNTSIEAIAIGSEYAYFVAKDCIFQLDKATDEIQIHKSNTVLYSNPILNQERLYISNLNQQILRLDSDGFKVVYSQGHIKKPSNIIRMCNGINGSILGLMRNGHLFSFDGKSFKLHRKIFSTNRPIDPYVHQLNNGSIILSMSKDIDHFPGLDNDRIRRLDIVLSDFPIIAKYTALSPDRKHFWISNGSLLAQLEVDAPSTRFSRQQGIQAEVRGIMRNGEDLYIDTHLSIEHGEYTENKVFERFQDSRFLRNRRTRILGSSENGLYASINNQLRLVRKDRVYDPNNKILLNRANDRSPNLLAMDDKREIHVFERGIDGWNVIPSRFAFEAKVTNLVVSEEQEIWATVGVGTIAHLFRLNGKYTKTTYGSSEGLPEEAIKPILLDRSILFLTSKTLLQFDPEKQEFRPFSDFNYVFDQLENPTNIWRDSSKRLWASSSEKIGIFRKSKTGNYYLDTSPLDSFTIAQPTFLRAEANGELWFGSIIGLIKCDSTVIKDDTIAPNLFIFQINRFGSSTPLYDYNAAGSRDLEELELNTDENSIQIELCSPNMTPQDNFETRYRLGPKEVWSDWRSELSIELVGLPLGQSELEIQAKKPSGEEYQVASFNLLVAKPFYLQPTAFLLYAVTLGVICYISVAIISLRLKRRNKQLENLVAKRTQALEENANTLRETMDELRDTQTKLLESARLAGMADVSISILHNVGNVMNNIIVSMGSIKMKANKSKVDMLGKAVGLLERNKDNLAKFLTEDARGNRLPELLNNLNAVLLSEREYTLKEIETAMTSASHATSIIATQQKNARTINVISTFSLFELVESAFSFGVPSKWKRHIEQEIDVPADFEVSLDQHTLLQIVTNFVKNASESIMDNGGKDGLIRIQVQANEEKAGYFVMKITDNGGGIEQENIDRIFTMGFTTKNYGHGFGMHASANSAKQLGGSISINSDGIGKGATVNLELPIDLGNDQEELPDQTALTGSN